MRTFTAFPCSKCATPDTATLKDKRKIITAVGRELLGFIWAIGTKAEATVMQRIAA